MICTGCGFALGIGAIKGRCPKCHTEIAPQPQEEACERCGGSREEQITVGTGNDRIPELRPCPDCTTSPGGEA